MKTKLILFLFLPAFCLAQDSLRYNQWSLGFNFASILNASPELNSEFLFNEKTSAKIDVGFRPKINTIAWTDKLENRKVGGYFAKLGLRFYNRTQDRKRTFYTGAGLILANCNSSANVVVKDYYDTLYRPVKASNFTYGLFGNLGFQSKLGKKLLIEMGGGYNFLFNGNDTILNHYASISSAQPGLGNISFSAKSMNISNGISLNISIRYILYYRNEKLKKEESDYAK